MQKLLINFFGVIVISTSLNAADKLDRFEGRAYQDADRNKLQYRLLYPKKLDAKKAYPLVLFFHGAGERGDDNRKQLVHGMADFSSDKTMEKYPCFVVAPQCPSGVQWVDTPWTADSHEMPERPTEPMRLSLELVEHLSSVLPIDKQRIYVTGLSMGGFGVWDAIQRHPDRFAAAVPICSGGDTRVEKVKPIASIPIWAFHGDKDSVVKTNRSRDMIAALKKSGGSPKYTEYADTDHNSWTPTYCNSEMYEWLFAQRRKK